MHPPNIVSIIAQQGIEKIGSKMKLLSIIVKELMVDVKCCEVDVVDCWGPHGSAKYQHGTPTGR